MFPNNSFNLEQQHIIQDYLDNLIDIPLHPLPHPLSIIQSWTDKQLFTFCQLANACYRKGVPIISDHHYDHLYLKEVAKRNPKHSLVTDIDDEGNAFSGVKVDLPQPMLSTEKAYDEEGIKKWLHRIEKAAIEIHINPSSLIIHVTPKLDGFAGYDDGKHLYTRGNGLRGTNISRTFERGLPIYNNTARGQGAGEIVVKKSYFNRYLAPYFEHPRNFQASLIKEKALDQYTQQAINEGAAMFVPFAQLPAWQGSIAQLEEQFSEIIHNTLHSVDFDVDGVVLEITNTSLKNYMGANRHHHRWQIAFKNNTESAKVKVLSVTPQTGRTGKITPVAELSPTVLSGATIKRATAHHYGMVKKDKIGAGAIIQLTRSGQVIPKIEKVLVAGEVNIPGHCPHCNSLLLWDNDLLYCPNHTHCPAQIMLTLEYFFKELGNIDGFGKATIEKLYQQGIQSLSAIYQLNVKQLIKMDFGEKTANNIYSELQRSRTEAIEDWRFLSAFGMDRMGAGNCERLLQYYPLSDIFSLTKEQIITIEGFAQLTAETVLSGLQNIKSEFMSLYQLKFNLIPTPLLNENSEARFLIGKILCFTGTMQQGNRDFMKKQAKELGAKVVSSVSSKTDYLIIGAKVGQKKIQNAQQKGVQILTENEYLHLLNTNISSHF